MWEMEIKGLQFETSSGNKVSKTLSQRTSQEWWCMFIGGIGRRIVV
jgi:hypothetical protein